MDVLMGFGMYITSHATELIGFLLPPLVDILNKDVPNEDERFIVAILVCVTAAIALHWNELLAGSPQAAAAAFSIIFLESQTVFRLYFKSSLLRAHLQEKLRGSPSPSVSPSHAV